VSDDGPSSWRDIGVKKTTLGFVASIFIAGGAFAYQGSMVMGRISDLERSVQHFDTGLTTELNADLADMQVDIDANSTAIDGLQRQRSADLERNSPHWVVDALQDELLQLENRVDRLEEDD
tara:strand:- start:2468 stop:2830 length:363 start_codon:yes stop_codon:yes gene_type:complete